MNEEQIKYVVGFAMLVVLAFFFLFVNLKAGRPTTKRLSFYSMYLTVIAAIVCVGKVLL